MPFRIFCLLPPHRTGSLLPIHTGQDFTSFDLCVTQPGVKEETLWISERIKCAVLMLLEKHTGEKLEGAKQGGANRNGDYHFAEHNPHHTDDFTHFA